MTKKEAKRLSILKWEFIVKNDGDYKLCKLPEELRNLESQCGFCEKYYKKDCDGCPINNTDIGKCWYDKHPYSTWYHNRTVSNAQIMLDLIKKS